MDPLTMVRLAQVVDATHSRVCLYENSGLYTVRAQPRPGAGYATDPQRTYQGRALADPLGDLLRDRGEEPAEWPGPGLIPVAGITAWAERLRHVYERHGLLGLIASLNLEETEPA